MAPQGDTRAVPRASDDDVDWQEFDSQPTARSDNFSIEDAKFDSVSLHYLEKSIEASLPEVTQLAKQLSENPSKQISGQDANASQIVANPLLDPHSAKFEARAWLENLVGIVSRDPQRYPTRTAAFSFQNLSVYGYGTPTDYQKTFGNYLLEFGRVFNFITRRGRSRIDILRNCEGLIQSGEMLLVLGRPGSGCSSLLKTIAGETQGFHVDPSSELNYQGVPAETMHENFRGECIYQDDVDVHFPQLTVGQTLAFAAEARAPSNRPSRVTRKQYAQHASDVIMAILGLSHTVNSKVGNDFVRGISGGERKRVSIAEAALGRSPLQCWDNSTRGLDSATALEFFKSLRLSTSLVKSTAVVAIYQASQAIYDVFDKVMVLYEGRQIYFGAKDDAREFFITMGFQCPERATTGDFLTSITSPNERRVRKGFEDRVPRTPDEFAVRWRCSEERARLLSAIGSFAQQYPLGSQVETFSRSRRAEQARRTRSPYTLSVPMQIRLCANRGFLRLRADMSLTITSVIGTTIMVLIIGSVFYNLPFHTGSFYSRGVLLFFAILVNAFSSVLEILTVFAQRPIVEKQVRYAFHHPFCEAVASMLCDLPNKIITSITSNLILYFLTNLRRTPGAFFTFFLFTFTCLMAMSMVFRTIASLSRGPAVAMAPAAVLAISLIVYAGFAVPICNMRPWFRWFNYLNPVAYAFESLMINEFSGQRFPCASFVPTGLGYSNISLSQHICSVTGAMAGDDFVDGDLYLKVSFSYMRAHLWRNLAILFGFVVFGLAVHLLASEFFSATPSRGEVLVFRRGQVPRLFSRVDEEAKPNSLFMSSGVSTQDDAHNGDSPVPVQKHTAMFHWSGVNYDIKIKPEPRRLLDDVDGWVKPGTLTALMGVTGAGKTSLLDVLAGRATAGVTSGQILVNGRQRNSGFQRKTAYVQQQDIHLATTTVREALIFSALLRQPKSVSRREKIDHVEDVIKSLEMGSYADAIVGVPGEGLNIEQRKRLTIAVELAAKPELLLFLDEPTSGLDSQSAWSIIVLLKRLARNGQAVLCTIHQPSAILFREFDNLLFLAGGGRTAYFGDIGRDFTHLTRYFERYGSRPCGSSENVAEWMLDVVEAAPGSQNTIDWPQVWRESPEKAKLKVQLARMKDKLGLEPGKDHPDSVREFAAPLGVQFYTVTKRVFEQYWRTPSYLYSKMFLTLASASDSTLSVIVLANRRQGFFVGFSFWDSPTSLQGLQNQLFSIFMLMFVCGNMMAQIIPQFVVQRSVYEARELPSKIYSWKVFILSNIVVELPWNTLMAVLLFCCWYYPIGMFRNAIPDSQVHERGALMFLLIWVFFMFTSSLAHMVVAGIENGEAAGNIAQLLFSLTVIFCGVLAGPTALPGFWIFMYRLSPFTYLVDAMLSTSLANARVVCSSIELLRFNPPSGQTCGHYLSSYVARTGGYVSNPNATAECGFCPLAETNAYLAANSSAYVDRWRNFGIMWAFVVFNVCGAVWLYWLARVPKGRMEEVVEAKTEGLAGR